ncbi:MAG TPA: bifunctional phosphopantothenoylcysteine decarboxylase/phosphopantothenate--cysteine ligase CoaBC [Bacteroidetes bacterium]|nr:bifunctional phosphopantothenoylcysteine decarboxylase/phosphopantothenate--cysteine ligase CoaBC [Bacteroidota bacterium]
MLDGKKIVLGVCGSIAAYKSAHLVRLLIKEGAEVKVILSKGATDFITPLTFATLSKNNVFSEFSNDLDQWNNHVELGLWADIMLIAPATANTIAKMSNGICDHFLLGTYLSAKCPVVIAPAMDLDMYKHPATISNIERLKSYKNRIIPAEYGELASGLIGDGRMAEPENIIKYLKDLFIKNDQGSALLKNKKAIITAGPTYEAIDPVRYISNHSTGKMGFSIAEVLAENGADVTLITGPSQQKEIHPNINRVNVTSAEEMFEACVSLFKDTDIAVLSAAVSDYKPAYIHENKLKKNTSEYQLNLIKTKDILKKLGEDKKAQILVGFALETENEIDNATKKLNNKNLDFIVLNSLQDKKSGFKYDTNKVTIIDNKGNIESLPLKQKKEVAKDIFNKILMCLN